MATRYDWLMSIGNGNANPMKVVALNRIPFYAASPAIAFVTKYFPEMTIDHHPIEQNPEMAQKIARVSQYEVEYLVKELETVYEELEALTDKWKAKCNEMEKKKRPSLMDDVKLEVARDRLKEYANQTVGVGQAISRVRTRLYELQALAGKQVSEWRI